MSRQEVERLLQGLYGYYIQKVPVQLVIERILETVPQLNDNEKKFRLLKYVYYLLNEKERETVSQLFKDFLQKNPPPEMPRINPLSMEIEILKIRKEYYQAFYGHLSELLSLAISIALEKTQFKPTQVQPPYVEIWEEEK